MKKCICFSRVSSLHQDLQAQQSAVLKAARKEYKASEIIEVSGKESAIKLKEEERQTLNELKSIVEENPSIESIYFFAVDRLARRVSVVQSIKEFADERKINLVFLNPYPFSTWFRNTDGEWKKNEISDLYLMFLAYGAKMEMEIKNERFKAAKELMMKQNLVTGPIAFGYKKNSDKSIGINVEEAKVIKWIFESYLERGMSTLQIYDEAVKLGYLPKHSNQRANKSGKIRRILMNKIYCGKPTPKGQVYPIIIEEEDIDKAIELMKERKIKPKVYTKNVYYCKGYLKDEESNTAMIVDRNHIRYTSDNAKSKYAINLNICDSLIWATAYECKWNLMSLENSEEQIEYTKSQMEEVSTKIINLKKMVDAFETKYDVAYDAYISSNGRISAKKYNETIKNIDKEKSELQKEINALEKRESELSNMLVELNKKNKLDISIYTLSNIKDDEQRMEIIRECITNMTVKKLNNGIYHIKVYHLNYTSPNEYIYIPHGGVKTELYWKVGRCSLTEFDAATALANGEIIDCSELIEYRFKKEYK